MFIFGGVEEDCNGRWEVVSEILKMIDGIVKFVNFLFLLNDLFVVLWLVNDIL